MNGRLNRMRSQPFPLKTPGDWQQNIRLLNTSMLLGTASSRRVSSPLVYGQAALGNGLSGRSLLF
jgi:hypothetical protein